MRVNEIKNETDELEKWEEKIKREDLKYKTKKYMYDFLQYETIRSFGESIYTCKASIAEAEEHQKNLLKNMAEFDDKARPRAKKGKDKQEDTYKSVYDLCKGHSDLMLSHVEYFH